MNPMEIAVTAFVGIVASVVTAYITYRFTVKRERRSHERNIAAKLADIPSTLDSATRIMAIQFAEGVLVVKRLNENDRQRVFLPAGSRVTIGRNKGNHIVVDHPTISRTHMSVRSTEGRSFVEPLGATRPIKVNDSVVSKPRRLLNGDVITFDGVEDVSLVYVEMTR